MYGSMELMCCRLWMPCSPFWMFKSVIHIHEPQLWWMDGSVDGLGFRLFCEQVGHSDNNGGSYGLPMHLFITLALEEEIGVLRWNSNSVVMCCIDMDVLICSCVSCPNLCLMLEMARSIGADVKRAFTSQDVLHSPCPSLMDFPCSTKPYVFLI